MADVLTKKQRQFNMACIKRKNTKPELKLRKILFQRGYRGYRLDYSIIGKPDIVFSSKKLAIFIDGCFWHCCPACFIIPATRMDFWKNKIAGNVRRDKKVNQKLKKDGWTVLRFWEHEIRKKPERCICKITRHLIR